LRTRIPLIVLASGALLVPAAPASAASFRAHLEAPGHHPKAGKNWTIKVTVRSPSGKALRATAFYQFLFNGQVVSTQYPSPHGPPRHKPYHFKGSYRDPILWPKRSVGYPLTFRVVVHVRHRGTKHLDYKVRVRR
jgi:hypothetical protein